MASRATWKGMLKLSLVMVPVKMYAATESKARVSFCRLHAKCSGQTENKVWCPTCNAEVEEGGTIKGYEVGPNQHVTFADAELKSIAADDAPMEIVTVTDDPINPAYIDGTAYLVPDGKAHQAFETVRLALGDRVAFATVTLRERDMTVALEAQEHGFLVYKLRSAEQVRTFEDIGTAPVTVTPNKAEVGLAGQLMDQLVGTFSYESYHSPYQGRLQALVKAKVDGTAPPALIMSTAPQVVSLTDALTQSLKLAQVERKTAKLPVKAAKTAKALPIAAKARKRA